MSTQVAIAQINSIVGDLEGNRLRIAAVAQRAAAAGADIVITPELSLTGYPPEDLLLNNSFCEAAMTTLDALAADLAHFPGLYVLVGHPLTENGTRYNACSILSEGRIIDSYRKMALPNHSVFDEKRYFASGTQPLVFTVKDIRFGINICEDVWFPEAPALAREAGAEILLVTNASPYHMNKLPERCDILRKNVSAQGMAAIYVNLVGGQDELLFDGNSFALDRDGNICVRLLHCEEDFELVRCDKGNVLPGRQEKETSIEEDVYRALVLGTRDYVEKNGFPGIVLGLSGGVDSALTLAIATDALGKERVNAIMMPSLYTLEISLADARDMAERLGVNYDVIPIGKCFSAFLDTLSDRFSGFPEDVTEENIQARIRGTLLMALSNKTGSIVLTTGNKSELAVGYSTLYGDMAGGFAVIRDIPKTLVYRLCRYRNSLSDIIPERILTRAPSAELRPNQRDQDSLPPYEILDAIVKMFMEEGKSLREIVAAGYEQGVVERILSLIRKNEYKRRQAPIGIRITPHGFGRDWRHPITSKYRDN
ncbi:MAG: NAD+ synthase [Burkholderiaceae bacterium]|jgi:NAD+ synthase (glutamine-hydrolysing)|nr:NAD+ synthase [Burkholderiaceae bacterium]